MVRVAVLVGVALLAVALVVASMPGMASNTNYSSYDVKVTVLNTTKFTSLSYYMYNATGKVLQPVNSSYVQVLDYEIKSLKGSNYMPAVVLRLNAPTKDLNTNETVYYAYIFSNSYGESMLAAVADVNSTTNHVIRMQYFKISPVSGDVAIVRTSYDIVVEGPHWKLSIPLANFSNPRVMIMTDTQFLAGSINYVELRALTNPPSGFTLIRSGTGQATFTISARGDLSIWFDESHSGGDVDLFVFKSDNPYFSNASAAQSWSWLTAHCTVSLFADFAPQQATINAPGQVKFVVKRYSGDASAVHWRVAATLATHSTTSSAATQSHTQTTQTHTQTHGVHLFGSLHLFGRILSGNSVGTVVAILIVIFIIVAIVAVAKR